MNVQMDMPIYVISQSVHQHLKRYAYSLNRRYVFYEHIDFFLAFSFSFFALLAL